MNKNKIRWGILGCGRIARKFAADLSLVNGAELYAIASHRKENALEFASAYHVPFVYDDYEDMLKNENIDVVYIATTHNFHYENTLLSLHYGKAVLCEKAFAENADQAIEMIQFARSKKLFLMEALWTRFLPHFITMQELIASGIIGEVKTMMNAFGYIPAPDAPARLMKKELAGGSLLDIGVYTIFMALQVLGKPDHIQSQMTMSPTEVDLQTAMIFSYNNGAVAQNICTYQANLAVESFISGTKGFIKLPHRFHAPLEFIELGTHGILNKKTIPVKYTGGFGLHFEITHVMDCLYAGKTESNMMSHADSLLLMQTMDEVKKQARVNF
ncbi:MAG: Gfo/Idh/MocA family oxidoreductase [Bacteroidetes bacterium]|nr:Gfo/Idh/MocA family oxidoreductase [Bacteroidota bacterium]